MHCISEKTLRTALLLNSLTCDWKLVVLEKQAPKYIQSVSAFIKDWKERIEKVYLAMFATFSAILYLAISRNFL